MIHRRAVTLAYPKGTCSTVPFYFRGDDVYKEQEFLNSEFLQSRAEYHRRSQEVEELQIEYDRVLREFQSIGSYALKVASDLGGDSLCTAEHANLLKEISELENLCQNFEKEIARYNTLANPIEYERLDKEFAAVSLELENLARIIALSEESCRELETGVARITSSVEYLKAQCSAMEARVAQQCCHRIQGEFQQLLNSLNAAPSEPTGKRTASANLAVRPGDPIGPLLDARMECNLELMEMELKKRLATLHRRHAVKSAVQTIVNMNAVLAAAGKEPVDMEEVRRKCDIERIEADERMSRGRTNPQSMSTSARADTPKQSGRTISARRRGR
jgi:NifB/MoaA-like Fe-S oxidoreductase